MASKKKVIKEERPPDAPLGVSDGPSSAGWHKVEAGFRCYKEYQYAQVRGITNPQAETPDPLAIGLLMHVGKGRWFSKQFDSSEEMLEKIRNEMLDYAMRAKLPMSVEAQQAALRYFTEYVNHWRVRPRPRVLSAEHLLGPSALKEGDDETGMLARTARLDDVSYYSEGGGALYIGETKTTSTSVPDAVNQYTLHGQPLLQMLLWDVAPQGRAKHGPVAGVMLDVIVKGYGGKPSTFARVPLPITQRALDWYKVNFRHTMKILANIDWDTKAPRNISACTRTYGRARVACPYRDLCMHGRSASIKYVLPGGKSLTSWRPSPGQETPPWE